jgi:pyrimidine deaminase RibD-like protein
MALKTSANSDGPHKLGAVVVSAGRVLSHQSNFYSNSLHAEVRAVNKVPEDLRKNSTIVVVRQRRTQKMGLAKPCGDCEAYLRKCGVKCVIYSNEQGDLEKLHL